MSLNIILFVFYADKNLFSHYENTVYRYNLLKIFNMEVWDKQ